MRTNEIVTPLSQAEHHSLINYLLRHGIRPTSFAYFLKEFISKEPAKVKSELSELLSQQLKAQAELIIYNLNH